MQVVYGANNSKGVNNFHLEIESQVRNPDLAFVIPRHFAPLQLILQEGVTLKPVWQ